MVSFHLHFLLSNPLFLKGTLLNTPSVPNACPPLSKDPSANKRNIEKNWKERKKEKNHSLQLCEVFPSIIVIGLFFHVNIFALSSIFSNAID